MSTYIGEKAVFAFKGTVKKETTVGELYSPQIYET
jgi:hypothetical protein